MKKVVLFTIPNILRNQVRNCLNEASYNVYYPIKYTTRPPRYGEKDGLNYHFVSKEVFEEMRGKEGTFFWEGSFAGHVYGLSYEEIEKNENVLIDDLLVGDVMRFRETYPDAIVVLGVDDIFLDDRERVQFKEITALFNTLAPIADHVFGIKAMGEFFGRIFQ